MKKLIYISVLLTLPLVAHTQYKFEDRTRLAGIDAQAFGQGEIAGGLAVFDFDNDGWEDLYLAGGQGYDYLYHNNQDGTFTNVIIEKMANHSGFRAYSHGGTAFDYDNDGLTDLFIISEGRDLMWKNGGDTNWTDVSQQVGIKVENEQNQSNCASFGDFDGDGDNDLYVARWVRQIFFRFDTIRNQTHYAHSSWPNYLYVNNGDGTFTERGAEFGVNDTGTSNIGMFFDYDRDGDLDIFSGNDFGFDLGVNQVYKNMLMETGKATFTNATNETGLGTALFCMGITGNDYDRDGDFDFAETSIGPMVFMQNNNNVFTDVAKEIGYPDGYIYHPNRKFMAVTWTTLFNDWDHDGWEDAFIQHGWLVAIPPYDTYEHDTSNFVRNLGGTFQDVTDSMSFYTEASGRGAANLDYDNDGRMDIIFGSLARSAGIATPDFKLWHNETPRDVSQKSRSWLKIKCVGGATTKEAIGTTIEVWAGGNRHMRQVSTGGGFASMTSLTQHFGCGSNTIADSIIIYWPANKFRQRQIDRHYNVPLFQAITYKQDTSKLPTISVSLPPDIVQTSVYPTPAVNEITIARNDDAQCAFEIYNVLGVRLLESASFEKETKISVRHLSPGVYTLRIIRGKSIETKTFIKQ